MVEVKPFNAGTNALVDLVASLTSPEVVTVVCGGYVPHPAMPYLHLDPLLIFPPV
jgi:hypothetical protein